MISSFPDKFKEYYDIPSDSIDQYYRLLLAIDLYLNEKISVGKAAELSGLKFDEFLDELRRRNIRRLTGYTIEDLENEMTMLEKYTRE